MQVSTCHGPSREEEAAASAEPAEVYPVESWKVYEAPSLSRFFAGGGDLGTKSC